MLKKYVELKHDDIPEQEWRTLWVGGKSIDRHRYLNDFFNTNLERMLTFIGAELLYNNADPVQYCDNLRQMATIYNLPQMVLDAVNNNIPADHVYQDIINKEKDEWPPGGDQVLHFLEGERERIEEVAESLAHVSPEARECLASDLRPYAEYVKKLHAKAAMFMAELQPKYDDDSPSPEEVLKSRDRKHQYSKSWVDFAGRKGFLKEHLALMHKAGFDETEADAEFPEEYQRQERHIKNYGAIIDRLLDLMRQGKGNDTVGQHASALESYKQFLEEKWNTKHKPPLAEETVGDAYRAFVMNYVFHCIDAGYIPDRLQKMMPRELTQRS